MANLTALGISQGLESHSAGIIEDEVGGLDVTDDLRVQLLEGGESEEDVRGCWEVRTEFKYTIVRG